MELTASKQRKGYAAVLMPRLDDVSPRRTTETDSSAIPTSESIATFAFRRLLDTDPSSTPVDGRTVNKVRYEYLTTHEIF